MVKWRKIRFACGRPRAQIPMCPYACELTNLMSIDNRAALRRPKSRGAALMLVELRGSRRNSKDVTPSKKYALWGLSNGSWDFRSNQ